MIQSLSPGTVSTEICWEPKFPNIQITPRTLEPVYRAFDLIPYREALNPYDTVLVKVNLITSHTYETGVTTDPIVVEAIINKIQSLGKRAVVVETDGGITSPDKAIIATGMMEVIDRLGAEYVNMAKLEEKIELKVKNPRAIKSFKVSKLATESAIISAASMKTLHHTTITMGLKNMFGMLTTKLKFPYHAKGMDNVIHDICKTLPPTMTVIDGFYGKEGRGPWQGKPVKMDTIIASTDPIAADATGGRVIGINPETIKHVKWLHEAGIGEIEDIQVVGDGIAKVLHVWNRE